MMILKNKELELIYSILQNTKFATKNIKLVYSLIELKKILKERLELYYDVIKKIMEENNIQPDPETGNYMFQTNSDAHKQASELNEVDNKINWVKIPLEFKDEFLEQINAFLDLDTFELIIDKLIEK